MPQLHSLASGPHLTLNAVCDLLDMSSLASMNSLQVWWLDLSIERLLAIYCPKGRTKEEPFQYAASYMQDQLELVGPLGQGFHYD